MSRDCTCGPAIVETIYGVKHLPGCPTNRPERGRCPLCLRDVAGGTFDGQWLPIRCSDHDAECPNYEAPRAGPPATSDPIVPALLVQDRETIRTARLLKEMGDPVPPGPLTAKLGDTLDAATALVMCKHESWQFDTHCAECGANRDNPARRPTLIQRLADALGIP